MTLRSIAANPYVAEREVLTQAVAGIRTVDDDGLLAPLLRARYRRQFAARKLRRGL
jgi:hypothetical protein